MLYFYDGKYSTFVILLCKVACLLQNEAVINISAIFVQSTLFYLALLDLTETEHELMKLELLKVS